MLTAMRDEGSSEASGAVTLPRAFTSRSRRKVVRR